MKSFTRKTLSISIALIGIIWLIAMFVFASLFGGEFEYLGSMIGGVVSVSISLLYLLFFRQPSGRQATEVGAVPIYYTVLYLAVTLILNTVLMFLHMGGLSLVLLLLNAGLTVGYVIVLLYSEKDTYRITAQVARTEQKLVSTGIIAQKLGMLISATEDSEIKKQLLKLKENVDYSSNISTSVTYDSEQKMILLLDDILQLTTENSDPAIIKDKIRQAEVTWKTRSSVASPAR